MKRYWFLMAAMLTVFLAAFLVVEGLGVPLLTDPSAWLGRGGLAAAALSVALLVADVFLPVPSSVVMIGNGVLFGVIPGTALSLLGCVGAAALGFGVGRRGGGLLERLVTPAEKARADRMLGRWGTLAVIATRPIPLLAETVAILAGASPMSWGRLLLASTVGALPPSLLYALTGATSRRLDSGLYVFGAVIASAGVVWWLGRRAGRDP